MRVGFVCKDGGAICDSYVIQMGVFSYLPDDTFSPPKTRTSGKQMKLLIVTKKIQTEAENNLLCLSSRDTTQSRVWIIDKMPHLDRVRSRRNIPSGSTCQCIHLLHVNADNSFSHFEPLIWTDSCVDLVLSEEAAQTHGVLMTPWEKCICPICLSRRRLIMRNLRRFSAWSISVHVCTLCWYRFLAPSKEHAYTVCIDVYVTRWEMQNAPTSDRTTFTKVFTYRNAKHTSTNVSVRKPEVGTTIKILLSRPTRDFYSLFCFARPSWSSDPSAVLFTELFAVSCGNVRHSSPLLLFFFFFCTLLHSLLSQTQSVFWCTVRWRCDVPSSGVCPLCSQCESISTTLLWSIKWTFPLSCSGHMLLFLECKNPWNFFFVSFILVCS